MPHEIIDTHLHVWDFSKARYEWLEGDTSILNRSYLLEEVLPQARQAKISGAVLVQAANNAEDTELMVEYARANPFVKGVVAWLPLTDPEKLRLMLPQLQPCIKGVRHLIHNEASPKWLLQSAVLESLEQLANAGLSFDLVGVENAHLETAIAVMEKLPGFRMVIDHLNQPPVYKDATHWQQLIQKFSSYPGAYAKISGLGTVVGALEHDWLSIVLPLVQYCLNCFGPQRCMLGSDWPVALLAGSYEEHWKRYAQLVDALVPSELQHFVYQTTAEEFYQLKSLE